MSCFHPLKAFPVGVHPSGKTKYKICSYNVHHVEILENGSVIPCTVPDRGGYCSKYISEFVEIPCGKCSGCKIDYSRQWANRCMLELEYHKSAYFVTLTYDDLHVPRTWYADPHTGEALPAYTLCKRDIQLFFKRLRKHFPDQKIRYFGCSEYGPKTQRPHYHFIIFGLELDDLEIYKQNKVVADGESMCYNYYNSKTLEKLWSFPARVNFPNTVQGVYDSPCNNEPTLAGYVVVGKVTWETCAYVARYVTKKLVGPYSEYYDYFNLEHPCTMMSRKPGIARQYYDDHPDLMKYSYINVSTPDGGKKFAPPRYYHKLFDVDDPEASAQMKEVRKAKALAMKEAKLAKTDLDYLSYLEVEEHAFEDRIKALTREVI